MARFDETALRTPGFSWQSMYALAMLAKQSYLGEAALGRVLSSGWGVEITAAADKDDTQGYVVESDHVAVLVFRGTESIGDWLINFNVLHATGDLGEMHRGFLRAYRDTVDILIPRLKAASAEGKTVWMTGHSLGGAIALNAAIETRNELNLTGLVTFGQPRAARYSAAMAIEAALGARFYRFVNNNDIVPRVPSTLFHAGQLNHFDGYGQLQPSISVSGLEAEHIPDQMPPPLNDAELAKLQETIIAIKSLEAEADEESLAVEGVFADTLGISLTGFLPSIADHSMDRYLTAIRKMLPSQGARLVEMESILAAMDTPSESTSSQSDDIPFFPAELEAFGYELESLDAIEQEEAPSFEGAAPSETRSLGAKPGPVLAGRLRRSRASRDVRKSLPSIEFKPETVQVSETGELQIGRASGVLKPAAAKIPLLLETTASWLPPEGLTICSQYRQICTVLATEAQYRALMNDMAISRVEKSRDAGMLDLDASVAFVHGDAVQGPQLDERGDAAILGIIDTGIDILHNAFRENAGTRTALIGIWDQCDDEGPTPHDVDPVAFSQAYGTLYTAENLNAYIATYLANPGASPATIPIRLRDPQRHGSHVAAIAAGRGSDKLSPGMAPEAPLLLVIPAMSQEAGAPKSVGYSNSHVDALAFLKRTAEGNNKLLAERMPIAINVSLGMNAGAHDGSTLLEAAFDTATNLGRDGGVAIVKSAGNERTHAGHARVQAFFGGLVDVAWESSNALRSEDYFEAWFHQFDDLAFRVIDPDGNRSQEVTFENGTVTSNLDGNICVLSLIQGYRDNGDNRFTLRILHQANPIKKGIWKLEIHGRTIASPNGYLDIWVERAGTRCVRFTAYEPNITLSIPGAAQTVITVGATNTQRPWKLNDASSYGPTRNGGAKPDLCAPGYQIRSAFAGQSDHDATFAMSGTSMAAPHVAGAIALVLSKLAKKPGAQWPNANQLGAALRRTVEGGPRAHNPGAGFGLLDAESFFEALN